MKKTLFNKYFSICSSIILISTTFLGLVLMIFAAQYFKADKYNLLSKNATVLAGITTANLRRNEYFYNKYLTVDATYLNNYYYIMGTAIDADIFLVDMEGKTLVCSHDGPCNHSSYLVPESVLDRVPADGEFRETGRLAGVYSSAYYTVGQPVIDSDGKIVGIVFASASSAALTSFLVDILQMYGISAVVVVLFSFIVIYFVTSNMVRPLQEMLAATRSFSKGDFSIRVPVEGDNEVAMLASAFNSMAGSLAVMESSRRSFTANVSHELKTPMTTIGGFIDGILDGTIPPERQDHYLRIVSAEVGRLSRLVRSMLSIARIEAGELVLNPTEADISDIVTRTVFSFEQAIEDKHVEIIGLDAERYMVEADSDLIYQVVYNLVDNAIKFVGEDGWLQFSYSTEGSFTYVSVKNSGEGITPEEIPKLFDRFYKSDKSRSLDKNGVGLGLSIVKTIVNLHNGEIFVKSEPGQYSEFVFSLPTAPAKKGSGIFRKKDQKDQKEQKDQPGSNPGP